MTILAEMLDQLLEQDPNASSECFLLARQYIQTRWQALHGTPMPEDSLTLFLIDPSRGDLTDAQKVFAHSTFQVVRGSYRRAAWDLIVCNRMLKDGVIQSPREFRSLNRRRYAGGGTQETRCEPLCAPGRDTPIPQHLKQIQKACDEAVRERGAVFCGPALPPGNQAILRPFEPAEKSTR